MTMTGLCYKTNNLSHSMTKRWTYVGSNGKINYYGYQSYKY